MNFMGNTRQQQQQQQQGLYDHDKDHHHRQGQQAAANSSIYSAGHDEDDQNNYSPHQIGVEGTGAGPSSTSMAQVVERQHMFDKVVTPSDVGKLNRLVIPKQHAERYFPLDSSTNDKGLLLNFEDRNGKPWRFRYSYWNSSQSYVMTKGWSRFVKEKKLDAGDIVSFQRGVGESAKDRLFIDWRRRPDAPVHHPGQEFGVHNLPFPLPGHRHFSFQNQQYPHRSNVVQPWNPLFLHPHPTSSQVIQTSQPLIRNMVSGSNYSYGSGPYGGAALPSNNVNVNQCSGSVIYFRSGAPQQQQHHQQHQLLQVGMMEMQQRGVEVAGGGIDPSQQHLPMVFESVPVVQGKAAAKRLRLFGVNMDCPISQDDNDMQEDEDDSCNHQCHMYFPPNPTPIPIPTTASSSSSSNIPYLQLRGTPVSSTTAVINSSTPDFLNNNKSSMSLDLDI